MTYQVAKKPCYVTLLACVLLNSCSLVHRASTAQNRNVQSSVEQSKDVELEEPLDPALVSLLQEQQIKKPFAWGLWSKTQETGGVIGINNNGELQRINFTRAPDGKYAITPSEAPHELSQCIETSGSLDIRHLVPDSEFPFKSNVLTSGDCNIHFILVWRALNRSLHETQLLDAIDVRIIVERNSQVISNESEKKAFFGVAAAYLKDINNDQRQEYVFIGDDNSKHLYVWTADTDCTVTSILFESEVEKEKTTDKSVSGKELFLGLDKRRRTYDIHTRSSEPYIKNGVFYWSVTESVYVWQKRERLYKKAREFSRRDKA